MTVGHPSSMTTTYHGKRCCPIFSKSVQISRVQTCLPHILTTKITQSEKWTSPNDAKLSEQSHFDPSLHNTNGKIGVSAPYYPHAFNDLVLEATKEMSDEFPYLPDLNDGKPIGIGE